MSEVVGYSFTHNPARYHVTACTLREGGGWIPYMVWHADYNDEVPAAEAWSNGEVYDYVLERFR